MTLNPADVFWPVAFSRAFAPKHVTPRYEQWLLWHASHRTRLEASRASTDPMPEGVLA